MKEALQRHTTKDDKDINNEYFFLNHSNIYNEDFTSSDANKVRIFDDSCGL
jgi:hypothetical protein